MQNWYLWAIIIILIPITAFVCYKAAVATKDAKREREKMINSLNRSRELKNEFEGIGEQGILDSDNARLLEGMALLTDLKLRKEIRPNEAFAGLPEERKIAYVLNCILEDCDGTVSSFFKRNTPPVSSLASVALSAAGMNELSGLFESVFPMFDEDDEEFSLDEEKIKAADKQFGRLFNKDDFILLAGQYIKNNARAFI